MQRHIDDDELVLSLEGELPKRRQSWIAQHLDGCPDCRERTDSLRVRLAQVETWYRDEFAYSSLAHDQGRARLAAALREASSAEPAWPARLAAMVGPLAPVRGLGFGAVVIAVCAVTFIAVRAAPDRTGVSIASGALPESALTPGAVSPLTAAELCNGVRPSRLVVDTVRDQVVRAYRMEHLPASAYELDALITPELGGSTDPDNLWPQPYHSPVWNARVKDELERLLPEMVCRGDITLTQAQHEIASDWIAAYKRHFKTDEPLRAHRGPAPDDEAELLIVAGEPPLQSAMVRLVSR